jgi:NADP-dependent aldehyde dehydrogenase
MTLVHGTNPRTGAPVGDGIAETTEAELENLLAAADGARGVFAVSSPATRAALLRTLADRLDAETESLAALAAEESGLALPRLTGEVARTSGQLRLFASVVEEGSYLQPIIDTAAGAQPDLRRYLESMGPVLVFAASNFPFAFSVLGGDTASALASGSPVVVKAHPSHPSLSYRIGTLTQQVVADAGLPAGVFGIVFGDQLGVSALKDVRIRACGFTGSTGGGRFLFDVASSRPDPIPFYGELGSVNPTVLTPAAVAARGADIASGFLGSFTLGTGQFCTKPGLLFVPAGFDVDALLGEKVSAAPSEPMLNARIADQFASGLAELSGHPDVRAVAHGTPVPSEGAWATPQLFATTAKALLADPCSLAEEHFGPTAVVVSYQDPVELIRALGTVEGSLTATVHAEDDDDFPLWELVRVLSAKAGRVIWNGWPTGVAVAWAMNHGGPWPASTSVAHTSVGATAIGRWVRPVCYQSVPDALLPPALQNANPWQVARRVDRVARPSTASVVGGVA